MWPQRINRFSGPSIHGIYNCRLLKQYMSIKYHQLYSVTLYRSAVYYLHIIYEGSSLHIFIIHIPAQPLLKVHNPHVR